MTTTSELKEKNLFRELKVLENKKSVYAEFEGRPVTLFCGNDYLGLSQEPRITHVMSEAAKVHGVGSGASRLISGTTESHRKLERVMARFKGTEEALVFSNGYMANLAVLTVFADIDSIIFFDRLCHASLIDGIKLSGSKFKSFPHKDYETLHHLLEKNQNLKPIILTETAFSMDGDKADFERLEEFKKKYGAFLIYDDAHGTGVFEDEFQGYGADIITGTFSKAFGGLGGFVCSSAQNREWLINKARTFIFDTSLPPALCEALFTAVVLVEEEPEFKARLWDNIGRISKIFNKLGFETGQPESAILPILLGDEKRALEAAEFLLERGVFIPAIRYPTVAKGAARLRLTVSAAHTSKDIDNLERILKDYADKH